MNNYPPRRFSDVLARLPASAKRKYSQLQATIDDAQALVRSSLEREKLIEHQVGSLEMQLERTEDAVQRKTLQADLKEAHSELESLNAERGKRNSVRANAEQVIAQLRDNFIPMLTGPVRPITITAQPDKGESIANAILRMRREISAVQGQLQQLKTASLPAAEIRAALTAHVDGMARQGAPHVQIESGAVKVVWPDENLFNPSSAPPGGASKLLAWLFHDEMVAAITAGVDNIKGGVAFADRAPREAELQALLLENERIEECFVMQGLAAGLEIHRRPYASGFAILGLERGEVESDADTESMAAAE